MSRPGSPAAKRFDALAPGYDAWYATPLGRLVDRLEAEAMLGLVDAEAGARTLDLSCGTGRWALALARRGLRVVGVDISEPMLLVARAKAREAGCGLRLVRADAGALPLRAGAFDLVTIVLGLEFMTPGGALDEARRLLKPGGRLVVAILNRASLWTLWRRLKRVIVPSVWRGAAFLHPDELGDLLRARGFDELGRKTAVHFLPLFRVRGIRWLERWEALGSRWMPAQATFVVVAARRL